MSKKIQIDFKDFIRNWGKTVVGIKRNNRMKIKDRVYTKVYSKVYTQLVSLILVFKCVQRLLFHFTYLTLSRYQVWCWRHISRYSRRFWDLSLFIELRFEFIHVILFVRFSYWYFFLKNLVERKHETFRLRNYLNVLQLPILDTGTVLYVVCKYLFALALDSLFLLYTVLCIPGKWHIN